MRQIISSFAKNFEENPALECPNNCDCHKNCHICLKHQYFDGIIDYSCKNRRMMYILRYSYVHSSEMYYLFDDYHEQIFSHLLSSDIKIRSIGAGPGLELFGFLRFINYCNSCEINQIKLHRVEFEEGWDEIFNKCWKLFEQSYFFPNSIEIKKVRSQQNVFRTNNSFSDCDILIYSYFWSEHLNNNQCLEVFERLAMSLEDKSIIILNDRPQEKVKYLFDDFQEIIDERITEIYTRDLSKHCGLSYDDELKEKFSPKLNCNCHQRILLLEN